MNKRRFMFLLGIVILLLFSGVAFMPWLIRQSAFKFDAALFDELAAALNTHVTAVAGGDAQATLASLATNHIPALQSLCRAQGLEFPAGYMASFQAPGAGWPDLRSLKLVALSWNDAYAGLMCKGNLAGCLGLTNTAPQYIIFQFEREADQWKYATLMLPPPHLAARLAEEGGGRSLLPPPR